MVLAIPYESHAITSKATSSMRFVSSFLIYLGGGDAIKNKDIELLSKFDLIVFDRFRYKNVNNNTWKELKKVNNDIKILLYQNGAEVSDNTDKQKPYFLNNIGRLNISRGNHSGSVSQNKEWFLTNDLGVRLKNKLNEHSYLLDYGNKEFKEYWVESTIEDIVKKPWKADGIMIDNCATAKINIVNKLLLNKPNKYSDAKSFDTALNGFLNYATAKLNQNQQMVMPNRTNSRLIDGEKAWLELDKSHHPPDIVFDEGAFSVSWGAGDVQFYSHEEWLRQVLLPSKIKNSSVAFLSHTGLKPDEKGVSSNGNSVSFEQIYWYSLGSYLLAKRETAPYTLFGFDYDRNKHGDYKRISWFDVYSNLNLGKAQGVAIPVSEKNKDIYFREFKTGYVYVNPLNTEVNDIPVVSENVVILDMKLNGELRYKELRAKNKMSMKAHTTVILLKRKS